MDLNKTSVLPEYVVIVNGPPRSGKDTIAEYLSSRYGFVVKSFKDALYDETAKRYSVTRDWILNGYEDNKDLPHDELGGKTKREALIDTSENEIKVKHGSDFFGQRAAESCLNDKSNANIVFPDGGFEEEVVPVSWVSKRIFLIRIYRPGKTFDGDSRSYLSGDNFQYVYDVHNGGTLDELYQKVDHFLELTHWKMPNEPDTGR